MPWTSRSARRHTKKANTKAKQKLWAKVANQTLRRTRNEGRAVRAANAVISRIRHSKRIRRR